MADDNLLAALTGLTEGFSSVYVPYTLEQEKQRSELRSKLDYLKQAEPYERRQAEFESGLRSKAEQEKFGREKYVSTEELPPLTAEFLQAKPNQRFRTETIPSTLGVVGKEKAARIRREDVAGLGKLEFLQFRNQLLREKNEAEKNYKEVDPYVTEMLQYLTEVEGKRLGKPKSKPIEPTISERDTFITGAVKKGYTRQQAEKIADDNGLK